MRYAFSIMGFLGILLFTIFPCAGIEPDKVEGIVYRLRSYTGAEHHTVFSPPQYEEIYLLADSHNAFDPGYTLVYYWPLTREYFASWEKLDVPVEGTLEILKDRKVLQTLSREEVLLSYPEGARESTSILLKGEQAVVKQQEYEALADKFEEEIAVFGQNMLQYRKDLREFMRADSRNKLEVELPKPPAEPIPPVFYVSDLTKSFVVNLPVGRYAARIRMEDGTIVEGSARTLVSFQPLQEKGVGYEIMPEERWTARVPADDPEGRIYCESGKALYLIPFRTEAYGENSYLRLINPQELGREGVRKWIHKNPIDNMRLLLLNDGKPVRMVEWKNYHVKQIPGAELGYKIVEHDKEAASGESPTFSAFSLYFEEKEWGKSYEIVLENPLTGKRILGSTRELRIVGKVEVLSLWFVSFISSIIGSCIVIWKRKKDRDEEKTEQ